MNMELIKKEIHHLLENEHEINKNGNTPSFNSDSISELEKLSELKDKGIITQEEFDNKKTNFRFLMSIHDLKNLRNYQN